MTAALKAVRIAENTGKPLNRCSLSFAFSAADRHDDDLVPWMQSAIAAHEPDYQQKKQQLYRVVGYEDGAGVGKVTISASNFDEIVNNFLGRGVRSRLTTFVLVWLPRIIGHSLVKDGGVEAGETSS